MIINAFWLVVELLALFGGVSFGLALLQRRIGNARLKGLPTVAVLGCCWWLLIFLVATGFVCPIGGDSLGGRRGCRGR